MPRSSSPRHTQACPEAHVHMAAHGSPHISYRGKPHTCERSPCRNANAEFRLQVEFPFPGAQGGRQLKQPEVTNRDGTPASFNFGGNSNEAEQSSGSSAADTTPSVCGSGETLVNSRCQGKSGGTALGLVLAAAAAVLVLLCCTCIALRVYRARFKPPEHELRPRRVGDKAARVPRAVLPSATMNRAGQPEFGADPLQLGGFGGSTTQLAALPTRFLEQLRRGGASEELEAAL